jgi:hypothetical protein
MPSRATPNQRLEVAVEETMSRRLSTSETFTCANCEIEIVGPPTFHVGLAFCCAGCVAGGPCTCSYDRGRTTDVDVRHCVDIRGALAADEGNPARRAEFEGTRR